MVAPLEAQLLNRTGDACREVRAGGRDDDTFVEFALADPEYGAGLRERLKTLLK